MKGIIRQNEACLEQALKLLAMLPEGAYTEKADRAFGASVGDHLRHALDHYLALEQGLPGGRIDYEARARDPGIATNPEVAKGVIAEVRAFLESLEARGDAGLLVRPDNGEDPDTSSTLARELNFLLSHTVHHFALIALICAERGHALPADFGMAPSTLRYQASRDNTCAR